MGGSRHGVPRFDTRFMPLLGSAFKKFGGRTTQLILHGKPGFACHALSCSKLWINP